MTINLTDIGMKAEIYEDQVMEIPSVAVKEYVISNSFADMDPPRMKLPTIPRSPFQQDAQKTVQHLLILLKISAIQVIWSFSGYKRHPDGRREENGVDQIRRQIWDRYEDHGAQTFRCNCQHAWINPLRP